MATYIAGISTIHAVLPKVEQVGGSDDTTIATGDAKVVVVGGNDLACFAAEGLSSLGVQVCLVSTGNPKVRSTNSSSNNKNSKNGRAAGKGENCGSQQVILESFYILATNSIMIMFYQLQQSRNCQTGGGIRRNRLFRVCGSVRFLVGYPGKRTSHEYCSFSTKQCKRR